MANELELLKIDPRALIDDLKAAYYDHTGETLQIGSDEYASAAAFAYTWGVIMGRINDATQNRYIDTATGVYLDAIAANYGINKRPDGYHAVASFQLAHAALNTDIPANALILQDSGGSQFTNPTPIHLGSTGFTTAMLYAVEPGASYNGIPSGSIGEIVEGGEYIISAIQYTMTEGGTDGFPYTVEGDNNFREWLKIEIQSFAGAGTYLAFEARAKNASALVKDAYVLRQTDSGYQRGKVKIYVLGDSNALDAVETACKDDAFRPVGDLVEVASSLVESTKIPLVTIQVTYPEKFTLIGNDRNARILNEYNDYLGEKINRPFTFEELCKRIVAKDSDGVYAIDAKPLNLTSITQSDAVYPSPGDVLSCIGRVSFNTVYSSRGA